LPSDIKEPDQDQPSLRKPRPRPRQATLDVPGLDDPLAAGYPDEQSLLRNPYVLAGLAVAASIVFAVMVVILFGGSDSSGGNLAPAGEDPAVAVEPLTPAAGRGLTARSIAAATVREGPGPEHTEIAPLRSGQDIEVIGRNQSSTWFQIYYPAGSDLKGWVPGSALRLPDGGNDKLTVVMPTPIPRPTVALPTPTAEPPASPTASATVAASPSPAASIDLAITIAACVPGTALVVNVANAGQAPVLNRQVRVTVASLSGVLGVADSVVSLPPGASIGIATNQVVQPTRMVARLDLIGAPLDGNGANNSAECVPGPGQPQPGR
jgi:hypothetical protein